jgi:hypothetical protein
MGLISRVMIFAILGTMFLGIVAVNAQPNTELPQFKSGASVMMGVPVDFNILNQRVDMIYEVVESNDSHIVWKFTGTTGDWAFVFADGRVIAASTVELDLATRDTLSKELVAIIDILNAVGGGISVDARTRAIDYAIYYASEAGIYHRIKYPFKQNFDLLLTVPASTVENGRLTISGTDSNGCSGGGDHHYFLDGKEVTGCSSCGYCSAPSVEIADKILPGVHSISSSSIDNGHIMYIEAITSPITKNFVLYSSDYSIWINETTQSMDLQALQKILNGEVSATEKGRDEH